METVGIERARNASGLVTPVTIQGVGAYIPDEVITNEMLTQTLETTNEWIQVKTGIEERRFCKKGSSHRICVYMPAIRQ